jgi:peptidoglycan/xylan/chitin deacetylase (PgdA/CDA1 family)
VKRYIYILTSLLLLISLALPSALVHAASSNLIANPLVETPSATNSSLPADWSQGNWGANTTAFSYPTTGSASDTRSVEVNVSSYTSGDAKWYFAPVAVTAGDSYTYSDSYTATTPTEVIAQYQTASGTLSYQDFGSAPASASWVQYSDSFAVPAGTTEMTIFHLIESVGTLQTDNFSLSASAPVTTPTVSITSPSASTTLSGTTTVSATASDTSGIKQVQFELDNQPLGSPVTTAPYNYSWNTAGATNGTHSLTAIATNVGGTSTTSAAETVSVSNSTIVAPTSGNLIANPLVETASNTTTPANWSTGNWGTNTTTFSYPTTGNGTDTRSVEAQVSSYTNGDAKWYFAPVAVTPGNTYTYSDSYESTVATDVVAVFTAANGTVTYQDLGPAAASASAWSPYSATFTVPTGVQTMTVYHLISAVGSLKTDNYSLTSSTKPTVSITTPAANASVTGTTAITASPADNSGIKSVQFELDNQLLGSPVTAAPYTYSWNSTTATNGTHSLTAIVTNVNGVTAISAAVSVNVNNATTTNGNLIPNPLVQTASPTSTTTPANWASDIWGTNTTKFTYAKTGGYGTSGKLTVAMTKYTSGDGKWAFNAVPATADTMYKFSEYYESNVQTQVDAVFNMSDGSTIYQIVGQPEPATKWTNFTTEFALPQGTQSITMYHLIQSVGTLSTSDFSMTPYKPVGFSKPLLTLTFDDGYVNQYTETMPLLSQYGFDSTQFIITDLLNQAGYLTNAEVDDLYTAGNEIASHTVTHDDLTQETAAQLKTEMSQSQTTLQSITGSKVTDMAYPYGLYNTATLSATKAYYSGARGVEDGYNSIDNFNAYDLKAQNVYNTTTTAQIADWVAQAKATNTWLVLVYHSVDPDTTSAIDGGIYNVTPTQLNDQLAAIKSSGISVVTMSQAMAEVTPQLAQ